MRLLYLYPEEWTGRRAREAHTLSTCAALAREGVDVTLVTAGGLAEMQHHLPDVAGDKQIPGLELVALSRSLGPVRSTAIFRRYFRNWLATQKRFDWAYIIHLKAAPMLAASRIPYAYEAHEIFTETPQKDEKRQERLRNLERATLIGAAVRMATSVPLGSALSATFGLDNDFAIVPNAGLPPLDRNIGTPDGPFVYAGSIAGWKGLDLMIHAARDAKVPVKIVGGTSSEWKKLGKQIDTSGVDWHPRVTLAELPQAMTGARAGLIPTQPETPSGRYSCPMKIFDYARCGIPVISTALPSLQSLDIGPWCTQVLAPTQSAWADALKAFSYDSIHADAARAWSTEHTWTHRAETLISTFRVRRVGIS
jgi:glycosyltransferase involved in cell wall biosynthesis